MTPGARQGRRGPPAPRRPPLNLPRNPSNVFGALAAENLGYAKIELQETLAQGHGGGRGVVYLQPTRAAVAAEGRAYFRG